MVDGQDKSTNCFEKLPKAHESGDDGLAGYNFRPRKTNLMKQTMSSLKFRRSFTQPPITDRTVL